jgi:hypothetical protein
MAVKRVRTWCSTSPMNESGPAGGVPVILAASWPSAPVHTILEAGQLIEAEPTTR